LQKGEDYKIINNLRFILESKLEDIVDKRAEK
jgi:hypothetical protein